MALFRPTGHRVYLAIWATVEGLMYPRAPSLAFFPDEQPLTGAWLVGTHRSLSCCQPWPLGFSRALEGGRARAITCPYSHPLSCLFLSLPQK